ncbi:hypothetical protein Asp14428_73690 [Actinoplanes sp. NBRC 14428]|nr:hypothetical protein Asp14428_73690 [Actinoplanes sp. NBRC 14428]
MSGTAQDQVDQVLYSWSESNLLNGRGYGPVASSQSTDAALRAVDARLSALARVADSAGMARPPWSLCFVRGPNWAAIMRRSRNEENERLDIGHALVGCTSVVTPALALGLTHWPGWHREGAIPRPAVKVAGEELWGEFSKQVKGLDERCAKYESAVAAALTMRLADPVGKIGLLLADSLTPEDTVVVLWGMHRIMSALTRDARGADTFTTYAPHIGDAAHDQLALVCSPYAGTGSFGPSRKVGRPFEGGHRSRTAHQLVDIYLSSGRSGLEQSLEAGGVYRMSLVEERLDVLQATQTWTLGKRDQEVTWDGDAPATTPQAPVLPTTPPRPVETPTAPALPPWARQSLLHEVSALDGKSVVDLLRAATDLRERSAALDAEQRRPIFDLLVQRRFHVDRLRGEPPDVVEDILRSLVAVALGGDLNGLPGRRWWVITAPEMPNPVVLAVWHNAVVTKSWQTMLPWLELRNVRRGPAPIGFERPPRHPDPATRLRTVTSLPVLTMVLLIVLVFGIALGAWLNH